MPQRSSSVGEATQPTTTPLRRSARILQLQTNPRASKPTSMAIQVHRISDISATPSGSRSRSGSCLKDNCLQIISKNSKDSKLGPRTCEKSVSGRRVSRFTCNLKSNLSHNISSGDCRGKSLRVLKESSGGSINTVKLVDSKSKKSPLNDKLNGSEGLRRSRRLCDKENSLLESLNQAMPLAMYDRGKRNLGASPISPIGIGEKKSRCSDLFKCSMSKSRKKSGGGSGGSKMGRTNQFKGEERKGDSCKIIVCGLASSYDSLSICSTPGGRQGRRLNANREKDIKAGNSTELVVRDTERMITRSASKRMREKQERGSLRSPISQLEMRLTRSLVASSSLRAEEMESQGVDGNGKETHDCNKEVRCRLNQECLDALPLSNDAERGKKKAIASRDTEILGNKRKRKQAELQGADLGWSKEQEVALQRAYFAAKPSPHFWKRVAKLVPGKSAQECFDKVHSDNLTPLLTRHSSRTKKGYSSSDLVFSGCNLFKSAEKKGKQRRKTKPKSHVARRTVRHLLQKYSKVNQDNEADLFSILEPKSNPSLEVAQLTAAQSPSKHLLNSPCSSSKSGEISSSGHRRCLSRFSTSASKSPLTSPPVLKKVKNMALHERYIDQLHKREAKRKMQSRHHAKAVPSHNVGEENPALMKDVIRNAKEALVSDARDVISKFRHSQANIKDAFSQFEEEFPDDGDEDEDDGFVS